jgi:hypothetical protein
MTTKESRGALNQLRHVIETAFETSRSMSSFMDRVKEMISPELKEVMDETLTLKKGEELLEAITTPTAEEIETELNVPRTPEEEESDKRAIEYLMERAAAFDKDPEVIRKRKIFDEVTKTPIEFGAIYWIERDGMEDPLIFPGTALVIGNPKKGDKTVQVVPIHGYRELAIEGDVKLSESSEGYHLAGLIVPFWAEQPIPLERLKECHGRLSDEELERVSKVVTIPRTQPHFPEIKPSELTLFQEFFLACLGGFRAEGAVSLVFANWD